MPNPITGDYRGDEQEQTGAYQEPVVVTHLEDPTSKVQAHLDPSGNLYVNMASGTSATPIIQGISGTVALLPQYLGQVSISGTVPVSGIFYPPTQAISGTVGVLPAYLGSVLLVSGTGQAAMAVSMPVAIASDQSSFAVKGGALDFSVNLTVTNGLYSIGDVVGGLITITGAVSANGKSLLIDSITLAGMTSAIPYELWLLNADLATGTVVDNGVFTGAAADVPKFLAWIPISTVDQTQFQNSIFCASVPVGKKVKAGAATTTIYGYIKATAVTSPGVTAMTLNINGRWVD